MQSVIRKILWAASMGEQYREQLAVYREALEENTGRTVKESFLYLFDADLELAG